MEGLAVPLQAIAQGLGSIKNSVVNSIKESIESAKQNWSNISTVISNIKEAIIDKIQEGLNNWLKFFEKLSEIRENILAIPKKMIELLQELNRLLWIPNDSVFDNFVTKVKAKFPFIESVDSTIKIVVSRLNGIGKRPPTITFPLGKTSLGKYGVSDITITFGWFEEYRSTVHNLISAILWIIFIFNQYFGIKNLLNASSSGIGSVTASIGRGDIG